MSSAVQPPSASSPASSPALPSSPRLRLWGRRLLGSLLALVLLGLSLLLLLRFVLWPQAYISKSWLETTLTQELGVHASIAQLDTYWDGLHPALRLHDLRLAAMASPESADLQVGEATAVLSWQSLLRLRVYLRQFQADDTTVRLQRDTQGQVYLAGLPLQSQNNGQHATLDWLLQQRHLSLQRLHILWQDDMLPGRADKPHPPLPAEIDYLKLDTLGNRHTLATRFTVDAIAPQPVELTARFRHPYLSAAGNWQHWQGQTDWRIPQLDLQALQQALPNAFATAGILSSTGTLDFANLRILRSQVHLQAQTAQLHLPGNPPTPLALRALQADIRHEYTHQLHRTTFSTLQWQLDEHAEMEPQFHALTVAWSPEQQANGWPRTLELSAAELELRALHLATRGLPLPEKVAQLLDTLQPQGRLRQARLHWEQTDTTPRYQASAQLQDVSFAAQPSPEASATLITPSPTSPPPSTTSASSIPPTLLTPASVHPVLHAGIPGVQHLSGQLDATQEGGTLILDSPQSRLTLPGVFAEPTLEFTKLQGSLRWAHDAEQLTVTTDHLSFANADLTGDVAGSYTHPLRPANPAERGYADLHGSLQQVAVTRIARYLPVTMPITRDYLAGALLGGEANHVRFELKGALQHFPFHDPAQGQFLIDIPVRKLVLQAAPHALQADGKTPKWPQFTDIEGTVTLERQGLRFLLPRARAYDAILSNVRGNLTDLQDPHNRLVVTGQASGPMQAFVHYLNASPIAGWTGHFTQDAQTSGQGRLALEVQLPLHHDGPATVNGQLQFINSDVALLSSLPPFIGMNGSLQFDEHRVTLQDLRGRFLGGNLLLTGGTQAEGAIQLTAQGNASAAGIQQAWAGTSLASWASKLHGATPYQASLRIPPHTNPSSLGSDTAAHTQATPTTLELQVHSELAGLALDLPAPIGKAATQSRPLHLQMRATHPPADDNHTDIHEDWQLRLGDTMTAHLERLRSQLANTSERIRGTYVIDKHVGRASPPLPDSGVQGIIRLDSLDLDLWHTVVRDLADASPTPLGAAAPTASSSSWLPSRVAVQINQAKLTDRLVNQVVAGLSREGDTWQANVDSPQLSGWLRWKPQGSGLPFGELTARLQRLIIPDTVEEEGFTTAVEERSRDIPAIDLTAEHFEIHGHHFGKLGLKARNLGTDNGRDSPPEWRLDALTLQQPAATLTATGNWRLPSRNVPTSGGSLGGDRRLTTLDFKLNIADGGALLDQLGLPKTLQRGHGTLQGEVAWRGSPVSLDYGSMSGKLSLEMEKGQLLKVEPGAARLLGVLSLQSLRRLATFDLRSLAGEGAAFDAIHATGTIQNGIGKSDDFVMLSPQATVMMQGNADIAKETQDLRIVVLPNFNAGSASLAYAVINPALGLGTFLAQLLLSEQFAKILKSEYQVTGTWADPQVNKLSSAQAGSNPSNSATPPKKEPR